MTIRAIVEAIASGSDIAESVRGFTPSMSHSDAFLIHRARRFEESTWASTYRTSRAEIRKALHGELSEIVESIPRNRFRVLSSARAPKNPERYLPKVLESLEVFRGIYAEIRDKAADGAGKTFRRLPIDEAIAATAIRTFMSSLARSSSEIVEACDLVLARGVNNATAELVSFHDLIADAAEDFKVALVYSQRATPPGDQP